MKTTIDAMKRIHAWVNNDAPSSDDSEAKWDRLSVVQKDIQWLLTSEQAKTEPSVQDHLDSMSYYKNSPVKEEAQTVEPVGEVVLRVIPAGHGTPEEDTYDIKWRNGFSPFDYKGPLFTHPAPATKPAKAKGEAQTCVTRRDIK